MTAATDWPALLPDVARRLRGEPERIEAGGATWRYGSHGSLAVHVGGAARGTWRDFEADVSGGTLALVEHLAHTDHDGALRWLVDARLIGPPAGRHNGRGHWRRGGSTGRAPRRRRARVRPKPTAPTADVVRAVLTAAVPADDTPGAAYLAARGTWPADGPPLPAAVRWLPPGAWEHLPTGPATMAARAA